MNIKQKQLLANHCTNGVGKQVSTLGAAWKASMRKKCVTSATSFPRVLHSRYPLVLARPTHSPWYSSTFLLPSCLCWGYVRESALEEGGSGLWRTPWESRPCPGLCHFLPGQLELWRWFSQLPRESAQRTLPTEHAHQEHSAILYTVNLCLNRGHHFNQWH